MSQNLTVHLAKIIGTPSQNRWSQTHTFFPEDEEKQEKRGILLACFSFSGGQEGIEAVSIGREILSRLHEEFYGQVEGDTFSRLSQAVDKVCHEFSSQEQRLEIVASSILGNVLYLASEGGGQVWIKRDSLFQKVFTGQKELEKGSGFLKKGDLLLLGTTSFFAGLSHGVLKAALEGSSPQEAVEALAPLISGQEDSSCDAAIIAQVDEEAVVEEILQEEEPAEELARGEKGELVREKIRGFGLGILQKFGGLGKLWSGKVHLRRPRAFSSQERKKKKTVLSIAILLIFLLSASLVFGAKKKALNQKEEEYGKLYGEITRSLEEGQAIAELNPASSRQKLSEAKEKISQLEALEIEQEKTDELKKRLEEKLLLVIREKSFGEVPLFYDLGLLAAEIGAKRLCLAGHSLIVLDEAKGRLFAVDIEKKSGEILAGGEAFTGARLLTSYGDLVYVFTNNGIYQIDLNQKEKTLVVQKDDAWGEIAGFSSYLGSLYLLDKSGKIWRYPAAEEGFGSGRNWFAEGVSPDLSSSMAMAIDGSIWILTAPDKILKFTQGAFDPFGVAGLEKKFANPVVLRSEANTKNLYVLDKGEERIVVLAKSGEFKFQYLWSGLAQADDMVVSEAKGKILVLKEGKIYQIEIKENEGF